MLPLLKDKSPKLQALLRSLSSVRFENISGRKVYEEIDHPRPDDFIYGSHQTTIQIAAKDLRVTFKSHFSQGNVASILKDSRRASLKALYDLFMEYSNLVAGGLSQKLHAKGIVSGISLPMATSGFDELIASDLIRPSTFLDYWIVRGDGFIFTCTAQVDILSESWLDDFAMDDESGGEIEFL